MNIFRIQRFMTCRSFLPMARRRMAAFLCTRKFFIHGRNRYALLLSHCLTTTAVFAGLFLAMSRI